MIHVSVSEPATERGLKCLNCGQQTHGKLLSIRSCGGDSGNICRKCLIEFIKVITIEGAPERGCNAKLEG